MREQVREWEEEKKGVYLGGVVELVCLLMLLLVPPPKKGKERGGEGEGGRGREGNSLGGSSFSSSSTSSSTTTPITTTSSSFPSTVTAMQEHCIKWLLKEVVPGLFSPSETDYIYLVRRLLFLESIHVYFGENPRFFLFGDEK